MLTLFTQTAIAVLQDIPFGVCMESAHFRLSEEDLGELLQKLESGGLIRLLPGQPEGLLPSYELCRPLRELSLLEVIEATGEPINCKYPTPESFYSRHGRVAQKMGVANHMVRLFLNDIKLCDW